MKGSIVKKGENRFLVRVFVGRDSNGVPKHFNRTVRGTKREAQRFLADKLSELNSGTLISESGEYLRDFMIRWIDDVAKIKVRETTWQSYERLIKKHISPSLGHHRLQDLKTYHIQRFYNDLSSKGLSPRTVRYVHSVLAQALDKAISWSLIRINPASPCSLPSLAAKEMKCLTPEEAKRFLTVARQTKHHCLFLLAIETGMRVGEYLGLQWKDIDLVAGTISVVRSVNEKRGGGFYFTDPKTKNSKRFLTISDELIAALKEHRREQLAHRMRHAKVYDDLDLVFANEIGHPLNSRNLRYRHFEPLLQEAGIQRIRLYDLRHTTATLLLKAGIHPKVVSERLGHSKVSLTLDTYSHVLPSMQREASDAMKTLLFGT
jgi:integrase